MLFSFYIFHFNLIAKSLTFCQIRPNDIVKSTVKRGFQTAWTNPTTFLCTHVVYVIPLFTHTSASWSGRFCQGLPKYVPTSHPGLCVLIRSTLRRGTVLMNIWTMGCNQGFNPARQTGLQEPTVILGWIYLGCRNLPLETSAFDKLESKTRCYWLFEQ